MLAMSGKSGVAMAKLILVSHKPTDFELQKSRLRLKKTFEALKQSFHQIELFIAKHKVMQVYKYLLDVDYTLDDLETRVNFRKALSTAFLEIFEAKTDHDLPLTLEDCYENVRFAASVIKARRPALDRIPNHSAQIALSKPLNNKPSEKTFKPFKPTFFPRQRCKARTSWAQSIFFRAGSETQTDRSITWSHV